MHLFLSFVFSLVLLLTQSCKVQQNKIAEVDKSIKSETKTSKTADNNEDTYPVSEYTAKTNLENYSQAIFAGGCFWCTEAAFELISGVEDVISGYSGGHVSHPSYGAVGAGKTGHAEAIYIYYDPKVISYETLLDVFFVAHDPTTLNRQGPDAGEEYRSAIYFQNEEEQKIIDTKIKALNSSDLLPGKIVTEVKGYEEFWVAEGYHQNYYELHPNHSYVVKVSRPKVKKVMKAFPDLIKVQYR